MWDPEPSKERVSDWGGPATVWSLLCVAERVPQGRTESEGIILAAICWALSAKRRCHPEEALYLPTFSHSLIANKLLSLSLSVKVGRTTDTTSAVCPRAP